MDEIKAGRPKHYNPEHKVRALQVRCTEGEWLALLNALPASTRERFTLIVKAIDLLGEDDKS